MVIIKNPEQINGIRASSQLAAQTLKYALSLVRPGISTEEINKFTHKFIINNGAIPAPLNYEGFPKSICTSINNVVCHGIPSPKDILKNGDIINIDITTILHGYYGDVSATVGVDKISSETKLLIERTRTALTKAIAQLKPGRSLNKSVGVTIQNYLAPFGYSPVRELGGHGVGIHFHEDPFVFHYRHPDGDIILKPGMIFTIEPMVNASPNWHVTFDRSDGWTVRTRDGSLSCQFEHTILITPTGSEILTQL
ncbi:MAG: type I methionyl aminopeptidase [Candidatus Shapirobacteria bacterium]|nr:type I methionyl aminopeptidase [Candidatus Shapirobacteria bacterium]